MQFLFQLAFLSTKRYTPPKGSHLPTVGLPRYPIQPIQFSNYQYSSMHVGRQPKPTVPSVRVAKFPALCFGATFLPKKFSTRVANSQNIINPFCAVAGLSFLPRLMSTRVANSQNFKPNRSTTGYFTFLETTGSTRVVNSQNFFPTAAIITSSFLPRLMSTRVANSQNFFPTPAIITRSFLPRSHSARVLNA